VQVRDWSNHNARVISTASQSRDDSVAARLEAQRLARDTTTALQRTQREVQNQLTLRIDDIATRESDLDKAIADTFKEIGMLQNHLDLCRATDQKKVSVVEVHCCLTTAKYLFLFFPVLALAATAVLPVLHLPSNSIYTVDAVPANLCRLEMPIWRDRWSSISWVKTYSWVKTALFTVTKTKWLLHSAAPSQHISCKQI
jgi:hypothetical protein